MKSRMLLVVSAAAALALVGGLQAEEKAAKDKLAGIKCPVSGKDVSADATVDYKGGKLYLCCQGCPDGFEKNKDKLAAKANHQLVATNQAKQGACPMSGGKLNAATAIDVAGAKIAFCCNNCKGKAEKLGDKQVAELFNDKAFEKAKFTVAK